MAEKRGPYNTTDSCKYNRGVMCDDDEKRDCKCCGWNPKVEQARRNEIEMRYNVKKVGARVNDIFNQFRAGLITREEAHKQFDEMKISLLGSLKSVMPLK